MQKTLFEGEVEKIIARTTTGEITVLDGHIPLISSLRGPGLELIDKNGKKDITVNNILIHIPYNATGEFTLKTTLDYDFDKVIKEYTISVLCNNIKEYDLQDYDNNSMLEETETDILSEKIILDEAYKGNSVLSKSSVGSSNYLIIILSLLNVLFIIGILYMSKWFKV